MATHSSSDMGSISPVLLGIWIYFNLISNTIFLPLLVATFLFSTRANRHPTLINLCMTWIFSGIFSLLLFYAGKLEPDSPEPPKLLCIAQTSLLYGITPMCHYYWGSTYPSVSKGRMVVILYLVITENCIVHWYTHLSIVAFEGMCSVNYGSQNFNGRFLVVYLATFMYRNYRGMRQARHSTGLRLALLLRVLIFGLYILFGMVVNFVSMFYDHTFIEEMYTATILLVFGTQADVLRVWCFWRRDDLCMKPEPISPSQEPSWSIDFSKAPPPKDKGEPSRPVTSDLESGGAGHGGDRYLRLGN
ncbi:hypothetical protein DFS33DRAFT_1442972 [Desarmillaria ectypa]|nr:hypothetical protein DFS33DRAFT_1442972 [Desarmillaria ectypa]